MPDTIVPYARFLEIRQRRQRVAAEMTRQAIATPNGDSRDGQPAIIDCEAVSDEHCGTRSARATGIFIRPTPVID